MIRINENLIKEEIPEQLILNCLKIYKNDSKRLNRNKKYYLGEHKILNRLKRKDDPNNKIVNNYASYITDTVCGYFTGTPVSISSEKNIDKLQDMLNKLDINTHNSELARDLSIYGTAYELLYINEEGNLKITALPPEDTFVIYNNKMGYSSLFAIHFVDEKNINFEKVGYKIFVYTENEIYEYFSKDFSTIKLINTETHYFGKVPITQFFNNSEIKGDFEGVISQIDAYNTLMSDRLNDKEKFIDSILVISGFSFPEDEETYDDKEEKYEESTIEQVKRSRILEIPAENSDAKYLTSTLNETEVQVLANALKDDIHKFSHTPDFSDEKFSGNTSGVAMEFKLQALENLAKVKERFFIKGIKRRLKLIRNIFDKKGMELFEVSDLKITMSRVLPVNTLEIAQMINYLKDNACNETLIAQLPFIEDPKKEMEKLKKEREENNNRNNNNLLNTMAKASFNNIGG